MGQCEGDRLLSTGTCAMSSSSEAFPRAVLTPLDREPMPLAIIQRVRNRFLPTGAINIGAYGLNLLMKECAQHLPICRRPYIVGFDQTIPGFRHARRSIIGGTPDKAQFHSRAHWTLFQFGVHLLNLFLGGMQQFSKMSGNLADQVVFENLPFLRI